MENILILSSLLLWVFSIFNFFLILAIIRKMNVGDSSFRSDKIKIGDKPSEFVWQDLTGNIVRQSDYRDFDKLLVFVSPTCQPCIEQMPKLDDMYDKLQNHVKMFVVSMADATSTRELINMTEFKAPVFIQPSDSKFINDVYGISATPYYFFIDKSGKLVKGGSLDPRWQEFSQSLQMK